MRKLTNAQLKALDELLFNYYEIDKKIEVRKMEIRDVPNDDTNIGGSRSNRVSKPTELIVERWNCDQRLNSLYAQKEAVLKTLEVLGDDLTTIFNMRWGRGNVNTWEAIAYELNYDRSTIYRKRERILEIFADYYGFT